MIDDVHDCNSQNTCTLLNPSLNRLLKYQDLAERIVKVEEAFFSDMKYFDRLKSFPMDLIGWCDQHSVFQVPNLEFVQELAREIKEIGAEIILEVGAGRGTISRHISKMIHNNIILTDNYSWWNNEHNKEKIEFPDVINMNYKDAIEKYKPDLIIASWIPYKAYWTKDFRECPSAKGYIIIGEDRGGCTGSEEDWNTDWSIKNLKNVEKYGICKTDHGFSIKDGTFRMFRISHTRVTYFERPRKEEYDWT